MLFFLIMRVCSPSCSLLSRLSIYLRVESALQLAEESALHSEHKRNKKHKAYATHRDVWPKNRVKLLIINDEDHYYRSDNADDINYEQGHHIVALALEVGEEQHCGYHKRGEGDDGDYERTPVDAGGNQNVDEYEHYDGIRDKFNELAGAVVFDHIYGDAHIPDNVKSEKGDDRPRRSADSQIDYWSGDGEDYEGEAEYSYELRSRRFLFAQLGICDINIHSSGSLLPWDSAPRERADCTFFLQIRERRCSL